MSHEIMKTMEEPEMHIAKWKESIRKGCRLYDSNSIKIQEMCNYRDSKKMICCQSN